MKKRFVSFLLLLLLAVTAEAQSGLTGTWEGTTGNGARIVLNIKASETTLTGTLTRLDETVEITEGKVKKNAFTFNAVIGGQPEAFTGELAGEELKVFLDRRGPDSTVVFKRMKK